MNNISPNAVVALSNVLTAMEGNLNQKRLLFTALSVFNPFDGEMTGGLKEAISTALLANDTRKRKKSEVEVTTTAIEEYFEENPSLCHFRFDYNEFINYWGMSKTGSFAKLQQAGDGLTSKNYNYGYKSANNNEVSDSISVCNRVKITFNEEVLIKISPAFMPFLVYASKLFRMNGYHKIPLEILQNKKSEHTFTILSLMLKHYKRDGSPKQNFKFTVENFRKYTNTVDIYEKFKDLRVGVIDKAVKDINKDEDSGIKINVEYITTKQGRGRPKVSTIAFDFEAPSLLKKTSEKQINAIKKETKKLENIARREAILGETTNSTPEHHNNRNQAAGENLRKKAQARIKKTEHSLEEQLDILDNIGDDGFLFT